MGKERKAGDMRGKLGVSRAWDPGVANCSSEEQGPLSYSGPTDQGQQSLVLADSEGLDDAHGRCCENSWDAASSKPTWGFS